jgi:hypothetical protein
MALFAAGGYLTELVALLPSLGGILTGLVGLLKFLDERRKRKAVERKLAETLERIKALVGGQDRSDENQGSAANRRLDEILSLLRESLPPVRSNDGRQTP